MKRLFRYIRAFVRAYLAREKYLVMCRWIGVSRRDARTMAQIFLYDYADAWVTMAAADPELVRVVAQAARDYWPGYA